MSIVDIVFIVVALVCCSGGSAWLLWDLRKQLKEYDEFMHKKENKNE